MCDYESLNSRYNQSQAECRQLKEKLAATEAELRTLQNALEPAVDEYGQLQQRLQIEQGCRSEAEKYACKLRKQNVELKRRSQQLLEKMQVVDINIDEVDVVSDSSADEDVTQTLNKKILLLEETVRSLEGRLVTEETEKLAVYERETQLSSKIRNLEEELADAQQEVEDFHKEMKKIRRVSEMAWKEFEELKAERDRLLMLQSEAENYAHKMMSERDAMKRESSILQSSATADERLASALMSVEQLTMKLSQEQHNHQQQMASLRQELDGSVLERQISELEDKLDIAVSENDRLQRNIKELEKWKQKLEKENVDLVNKLDVAEQKLRPPPPPPAPPPPPPFILNPLRLFIRKKPASGSSGTSSATATTKAGTPRDKTYEEALQEMMQRIKSGQALKPSVVEQPDCGVKARNDACGSTAIENLQNLLHGRQGLSMDEKIAHHKTQRQISQQQEQATDCELQKAFGRLRQPKTPVSDVIQSHATCSFNTV